MLSDNIRRFSRESWEAAQKDLGEAGRAAQRELDRLTGDERSLMELALGTLPASDVASVPFDVLLGYARHALRLRRKQRRRGNEGGGHHEARAALLLRVDVPAEPGTKPGLRCGAQSGEQLLLHAEDAHGGRRDLLAHARHTSSTFAASVQILPKPEMDVMAARSSWRSMSLSYSTPTSPACTISSA